MDRQIVYPGSVPLDTDVLNIQRNVMVSIAALARAVLGDTGLVDGMGCVPGSGPYSVVVGPGSFTAPFMVDGTAFGSLAADPALVVRTALNVADTVLELGPPASASQVLCWLVQATIVEADAGPVALPYWNAANPSVPWSGPGNSGLAQSTQRQLRVLVSAKASRAEIFPVGTPPAADAGWFGLYAVTTFAGQTAVLPSNIAEVVGAPTMRFKLPVLPPGLTAMQTFTASGTWQAPPRVRWARVRVVGGGGGGGGGDGGYSGGGGGAGGYAESLLPVAPGQLYAIEVGAGGNPGVTGVTGVTGGETSFAGLVVASGGQGGASRNPDSRGGNPGQGAVGQLLLGGGFGGDGAVVAGIPAGNGGASAFGGGGRGRADPGAGPDVGLAAGSGGGGGYGGGATGGLAANGLVVIEY